MRQTQHMHRTQYNAAINQKIYYPVFCLLFLFTLLSPFQLEAQKDDDRIYKIRVASARGQIFIDNFQKLNRYGILLFEPADNGYTRVYLGTYIGRNTALKILNSVKAAGFRSAYLVLDQELYNSSTPQEVIYYTYQLCATRKLNLSKVLNKMDPINAQSVHLTYANGFYRYSLGIYDKGILPQSDNNFQALAFSLGFTEGFAKPIKK